MKREVFRRQGALAVAPQAWGHEYDITIESGRDAFELTDDVAVVDVNGPLVHHQNWCWDSYDEIRARVAEAMASPARSVVMRINSPGGDVEGCFELSRELRTMATTSGKPLLAYADGMAASAAYALACAAERIVVPSTGFVGSIGVVEALADQTGLDEKLGIRFAIVTSGERKADGNPHVAISSEAVAAMQVQVDGLADLFFDLVEELRGMPVAKAKALQASMVFGERAVKAGLADEVQTWAEFISSASASTERKPAMPKYLDEAKASLRKAAEEGSDEEKTEAKKMLAAVEEEDSEDGKEKPKDEGKKAESEDGDGEKKKEAKAESGDDDKEKEAKAEGDEDEKKAKARASGSRPQATADVVSLAKRVHELEAERAAEKDEKLRSDLLAKRPDFSAEVQATLRDAPIAVLRNAAEKGPPVAGRGAAAASTVGTRGRTQVDDGGAVVSNDDVDFIDRAMGLRAQAGVIKRERNTLELGAMTPQQARAKLAELEKKGAA